MKSLKHLFLRFFLASANFCSSLIPPTRGFSVRRTLYRLAGLQIANSVRIVGGAKFHYHNIAVGAETWVGTETHFFTSSSAFISIGERVDIAPGCFMNTGTHEIGGEFRRAGRDIAYPISIGDGTWIGMGSKILGGTEVGQGCIIAAGAVVRGKFPDNVMIGGVPARIIKTLPIK